MRTKLKIVVEVFEDGDFSATVYENNANKDDFGRALLGLTLAKKKTMKLYKKKFANEGEGR